MSEVSKRRTFAIISHPDAGKTTLTEKLLLYGGAIKTAGSVKQEKQTRMLRVTGWKWKKKEEYLLPPLSCSFHMIIMSLIY